MKISIWVTFQSLKCNTNTCEHENNFDNSNLKVSVLLLVTVSNGSRFQIGMVRGMKLFLYVSFLAYICM